MEAINLERGRARALASRRTQGLPDYVEDPVVLAQDARLTREVGEWT